MLSGDASESVLFTQEHVSSLKFECIAPLTAAWSLVRPDEAFLRIFDQSQRQLTTALEQEFNVAVTLRNVSSRAL